MLCFLAEHSGANFHEHNVPREDEELASLEEEEFHEISMHHP
jgi:hypothetical protein